MSTSERTSNPGLMRRAAPVAAVALAFVVLAALSWRRLGSLLVDNGRELEVPRRILEGEMPYLDFRYYWGPLAPYLNAALYRVFGVSIDVLMWAGIASAALVAACVFLLARLFLGRWASASVAILFLAICAFPCLSPLAIFNFVLPHNYSATYGMVAASFSVLTLLLHLRSGRAIWIVVSVVLLAITALAKLEVLVAAASAHAAFLLLRVRRLARAHLVAYAAAVAVVAAAYGAISARVGPALWSDNLGALVNEGSRHYVRLTMGVDDLAAALGRAAVSLAGLAAAIGAGWAAATFATRESTGVGARATAVAAAGIAAFGVFAAMPVHVATASLPLAVAAVIAALLVRGRGRPAEEHVPLLVLAVFALASLARIWARVSPIQYGFVLLTPALVVLGVLLYDLVPRALGAGAWRSRAFAAVGLGVLAGIAAGVLEVSVQYYTEPRVEVATRRGRLLLPPGAPEVGLIDWLRLYPRGTKALAVPDGIGLLYAADLRAVGDMFSYVPMEMVGARAETRVLETWEAGPPQVVVWIRRDEREVFGYRGFGIDYAANAARWLIERYVPASDPNQEFVILVRGPAAPPRD